MNFQTCFFLILCLLRGNPNYSLPPTKEKRAQMSLTTPLLAGEEDGPPSLSYQPIPGMIESEQDSADDHLSRLVALSSLHPEGPLLLQPNRYSLISQYHHAEGSSSSPLWATTSTRRRRPAEPSQAGNTVLAASCFVLYIGLIWGAYLSPVWSKENLHISLMQNLDFENVSPSILVQLASATSERTGILASTTTTIKVSSLSTLLQDLFDTKQYILLFLVWLTGLVLPCLCMIVHPVMMWTDLQNGVHLHQRIGNPFSGRNLIENLNRFVLSSIFIFMMITITTDMIDVEVGATHLRLANQSFAPMAGFGIAVVFATAGIVTLRLPSSTKTMSGQNMEVDTGSTTATPPRRLIDQPWTLIDDQDEPPPMRVLEDTSLQSYEPSPNEPDTSTRRLEQHESSETPRPLTVPQKIFVYQLGLLSVVLWLPSLYVPFCALTVKGFAVDFIVAKPSLRLYLWDIPIHLWSTNHQSGTPMWITLTMVAIVVLSVIVVPLFLTCLGAFVWLADDRWSAPSLRYLYAWHPGACGPVFGIVSLLLLPNLRYFASFNDTQFCRIVSSFIGEGCLEIEGRILPGAYFLLIQSLVLECFLHYTFLWSSYF